jgi:hypothetical protein
MPRPSHSSRFLRTLSGTNIAPASQIRAFSMLLLHTRKKDRMAFEYIIRQMFIINRVKIVGIHTDTIVTCLESCIFFRRNQISAEILYLNKAITHQAYTHTNPDSLVYPSCSSQQARVMTDKFIPGQGISR